MVNGICVWVKNPISSWEEVELPHQTFGSAEAIINELCDLKQFVPNTIKNFHTELFCGNCAKSTFKIKSKVQEKYENVNQAEWKVKLFIEISR